MKHSLSCHKRMRNQNRSTKTNKSTYFIELHVRTTKPAICLNSHAKLSSRSTKQARPSYIETVV